MNFLSSKLAGLLSMLGTIAGLVLGGTTLKSNTLLAAAFFIVALVSFLAFALFLYNFIMFAQYEIPLENIPGEDDKEP